MSYGGVENTQEELAILTGATILSIKIEDLPDDLKEFDGDNKMVMKVRLKNPIELAEPDGSNKRTTRTLSFEIWADAEGNGPGFISLVGD